MTKLRFLKREVVRLPHSQGLRLISGRKVTEVSVRRADGHSDLFSAQTLGDGVVMMSSRFGLGTTKHTVCATNWRFGV